MITVNVVPLNMEDPHFPPIECDGVTILAKPINVVWIKWHKGDIFGEMITPNRNYVVAIK